jgi:hypothetical protein
MAIASLVSSLVAIPAYLMCFIGFIPAIVGIVLGVVGLNQVRRTGEKGKEMAVAGIAVGGASMVLAILLIALVSASGTTTF